MNHMSYTWKDHPEFSPYQSCLLRHRQVQAMGDGYLRLGEIGVGGCKLSLSASCIEYGCLRTKKTWTIIYLDIKKRQNKSECMIITAKVKQRCLIKSLKYETCELLVDLRIRVSFPDAAVPGEVCVALAELGSQWSWVGNGWKFWVLGPGLFFT